MSKSETRNCQNCKTDFIIEPDDFSFYEKIKVPPPTFCPSCRMQRRLAWMISLVLFKRKCNLCNEEVFSLYETDAPYNVFCHKCWWSDRWDAKEYAMEVDFSKPFFEQWNELLHKTPILGLSVDTTTGAFSPYTNHVGNSKNSYMIFYSDYIEDSMFGFYLSKDKSLLDCSMVWESELCYDSTNGFKNYKVHGSFGNVTQSLDSTFLRDSDNCQYCFGSANLKNQKYVFFNEQLPREEYMNRMSKIDLGSYSTYQEFKKKTSEHFMKFVPRPAYDDFSENISGSYVFQSKNCRECFDSSYCQDCKYVMLIKLPKVVDSYDYTEWGENASNIYESITVGCDVDHVKFSHESGFGLREVEYSKLSTGSSYNFGCVSIRKNEMPYVDKQGKIYKYGEFFPMEFSPHSYNNTFANFFFPLDKKTILNGGLKSYESVTKDYGITLNYTEMPDNIKDTNASILKEIIQCRSCSKGFKITKQEFDLCKRLNVPLSRKCPFCRIGEKINKWVSQMRQIERTCNKCDTKFITHYSKDEAPVIYCKKCYQKEIY